MGETGGAPLERGALAPVARDHQIGSVEGREPVNDVVQTLEGLDTADEEEVRARSGGSSGRRRARIVHEAGDHLHVARETKLAMLRAAEGADRNERIHLVEVLREQSGVTPQLGRTAIAQLAPHTLATGARLDAMPPEHVRRADEPVLVRGVELDR